MRTIYCVAILLVLAGCTSQEQIGSRQAAPQAAKQAAISRGQIAESHPAQEVALNRADDVAMPTIPWGARFERLPGLPRKLGQQPARP